MGPLYFLIANDNNNKLDLSLKNEVEKCFNNFFNANLNTTSPQIQFMYVYPEEAFSRNSGYFIDQKGMYKVLDTVLKEKEILITNTNDNKYTKMLCIVNPKDTTEKNHILNKLEEKGYFNTDSNEQQVFLCKIQFMYVYLSNSFSRNSSFFIDQNNKQCFVSDKLNTNEILSVNLYKDKPIKTLVTLVSQNEDKRKNFLSNISEFKKVNIDQDDIKNVMQMK